LISQTVEAELMVWSIARLASIGRNRG